MQMHVDPGVLDTTLDWMVDGDDHAPRAQMRVIIQVFSGRDNACRHPGILQDSWLLTVVSAPPSRR